MIKQKTKISIVCAIVMMAAIFLFNIVVSAQTNVPAKIEIQSLMIRKVFQRTPEGFLTYRTMQGADILFDGRSSRVNLPYMDSGAFPFPVSLSTVLPEFNRIFIAKSGGEFDLPQVRFYIDSMESEPINLLPTIPRKKYETRVTGKVRIRGKAEIYAERVLGEPWLPVAVDDDFDLVGTYTAYFRVFTEPDSSLTRKAKFEYITYNLTQAQ